MNFNSLYRLSFYAMLVAAAFVLSIDVTDGGPAILYPYGVAVAAAVAFVTVDRDPRRGSSSLLADLLAVLATGLALAEYTADDNHLVLALGHWLIYLTIIYMFRKKSMAGDDVMFRLGLFQVLVGTVLSSSDWTGAMLFVWAVLTLWVLGLMTLQREAIRSQALEPTDSGRESARLKALYPGLLNLSFVVSTFRVMLTTLALGGVIFLAMPRRFTMAKTDGKEAGGQHLTGFDDEVQLGQMGEILENDTVVMAVETFDESGRKIHPEGEPLWRGVTMARYEKGRWKRQRHTGDGTFPSKEPDLKLRDPSRPQGKIRQQIKLESNDSKALFGLRPMSDATVARGLQPILNSIDGTILRGEVKPGSYDYEVTSFRDVGIPQPGEPPPGSSLELLLKEVPSDIRPAFQAIAEEVIARELTPEERKDDRKKAEALDRYLRDSGKFSYTLKLDVIDNTIDPVLDFMVNRKEGHCEYFASALALLLRAVDIPARVVNGFKGGDWNDLANVMNVRQKHAHSWVEAYLGVEPGNERPPIWLTLDPTPGNERDASVARVGGFKGNFRQATDFVRFVWLFYIVGYNSERQNSLLYGPTRSLIREAKAGFAIMGEWFQKNYAKGLKLLTFQDVRSLFSLRGFLVAFSALLFLALLFKSLTAVIRRLWRWYRGPIDGAATLSAGAAHYRRLVELLGSLGLERPAAETQDEFAKRAAVFLHDRGQATRAVADVPGLIVDAFYRVRFGRFELPVEAAGTLESRLDALEATLKAPQHA